MYSVVLVVALAGSAEAPDCHHSCVGSCVGSYGGCYGVGHGHGRGHGCYGGGYGGCYGSSYGGCYGSSYGGCYGGGYGGCYGGYASCAGYSPYGGCGGAIYGGGKYVEPVKQMPMVDKDKKDEPIAAPANIVVNLPSGAKLSIDGYVSSQTTGTRYLVTPTLQPGQDYTYTLVAETVANGQAVQQSQKITVRAGATTPVSFTFGSTPAAASR
jgi:uncharacterized protein (TIGR03000 family)